MAEKVSIVFQLKDQASKSVGGLKKSFSDLGGKVKAFLSPANLAAAAIVGLGVAAVKQFNKFAALETQMVNVGNLYGATRKEVDGLTTELIELSKNTPQNLSDMADSLFDVVSAGVPAAESVAFLGDAAKLATAGVTNTKIAVDGLTSVMNAYQIAFDKAGTISDKFFAAQQKGKTTIAELSSNIGKVAPTAQAAGVSLDSLLGAVSALTLQGIKTSEATTQIKAALSNVLKPSQQAADLAAALGLEFNAQALEAQGLSGFLKSVNEATGGNIEANAQLFGSTEALNAVLALSKDEFKALDEVQKAVADSAGATDKAYKENLKTFAAQWQLIKNNTDALWSGLMRKLIPAVTATLTAFNKLFSFVGNELKVLSGTNERTADEIEARNKDLTKKINELETSKFAWAKKTKLKILQTELDANKKKLEDLRKTEKDSTQTIKAESKAQLDTKKSDRAAEVADIIANLDAKKDAEKSAFDDYSLWLAKEQSERDLSHQDKINKLNEIIALETTNADDREKLELALFKVKKNLREKEEKEKKDISDKEKKARETLKNSILESARTAADGERNILKATFNFFKEMIKKQVGAFIAARQAELAAFAAANFWNPAGWAAGAAVAGLEVLKNEAFAGIDRFQNGGVVPGSSFSGDKVPAFVNSGELILNKPQQNNIGQMLYKMANNPGSMGGGGMSDKGIIKKLDRIEHAIKQPAEIHLKGDSFSRAVYNKQKVMQRNGQISTRGRAS